VKLLQWFYLPPREELLRLFPELEYPSPNEWSHTPVTILPDGKSTKEIQVPNAYVRQGMPGIEKYLKKRQESADGSSRTLWHRFCSSFGWWEILTEEFVKAFSVNLFDRAWYYYQKKGAPIVIVEVGAGDGRLAAFVSIIKEVYMRDKGITFPVEIYACDSGSWGIQTHMQGIVEICDYKEFIMKKQPDIVYVSWMPQGQDWTQFFRDQSFIQEYIIIGDIDTGVTGHVWLSFGNSHLPPDQRPEPPYLRDNWSRFDLNEVSRFQISKLDKYGSWFNSSTVSFRRNESTIEIKEEIEVPYYFTTLPKLKLNF